MTLPQPVRMAIIGCGRIGRLHAERIARDSRGAVVALVDSDRAAASDLQRKLAPAAVIADTLEDISCESVDAVVICTPTHRHAAQVRFAWAQCWHVLCEKPLADTMEKIGQLVDEARSLPLVSMLAYQRRFWANYRTLRREILSGRWGRVRRVTSINTERWEQTIAGTWRDDPTTNPGGFLGDAGSHKLDAVGYITGERPREVFARTDKASRSVEITATLLGTLTNGAEFTFEFVGHAQQQTEDLTIHCEHADLMLRDWRVWIARNNHVRPLEPLEPDSDPVEGFLDLLIGHGSNCAEFDAALDVAAVTQAALKSAASGRFEPVG